MTKFTIKKNCRICGSNELIKYLDLGQMSLANQVVDPKNKFENEKFPLEVMYCKNCSNSQLSVVVAPEYMFRNYVYRSEMSNLFKEHCFKLEENVKEFFDNPSNCLVVGIASNDGTNLNEFKKLGFKVLGVDPAENPDEKRIPFDDKEIDFDWNIEEL